MAYTTIVFEDPKTGYMKETPVGFSWTTLFFGCFVPAFRADWKWAAIMLVAAGFSFGISWLIFPFMYNTLYIKDLIASGYKAKSVGSGTIDHIATKIGIHLPTL